MLQTPLKLQTELTSILDASAVIEESSDGCHNTEPRGAAYFSPPPPPTKIFGGDEFDSDTRRLLPLLSNLNVVQGGN